jgi:drug/metabolite transporter (DMT)-like permease
MGGLAPEMSSNRAILFMVGSVVLYTSANLCVKALSHLPTQELVFLRSAVSLVLCAAYLKWKGLPLLGVNRRWLIIRGITGMVALTAFFHTIRHIPLASATVIQYLSPMLTVLLAVLFGGQRMRRVQWLFFAGAFTGILMVKGFDSRISWGFLSLGIFAAFGAAFAYLATIKCRDTDHPVGIVIWFHLISVPLMGTWSAVTWVPPTGWNDWALAAGVGVLSIVAQVAMTVAITREDASVVMPFNYLGAILALIFGYLVFDELLTVWATAGIGLVILSILANIAFTRRRSNDSSPVLP